MLGPKPRAETTIGIKVVLEPKKKKIKTGNIFINLIKQGDKSEIKNNS